MPRQPRVEYAGALYHVMARGNCRAPIVLDDADRERFVKTLAEACEKAAWEVYAWVLLDKTTTTSPCARPLAISSKG